MGYTSRYSISVVDAHAEMLDVLRTEIRQTCPGAPEFTAVPGRMLRSSERWTWYEYKDELTKLSAVMRDTTIVVDREGSENGDLERSYFRDGAAVHVRPKIVWPEPPSWSQLP